MMDDDPLRKTIMTHAMAFTQCSGVQIAAAADIDKTRLRKFGERWSVKCLYTDYVNMLTKEHIDILSICTHSDSHYEIVEKAIEINNGLKAVFCEKPIAGTLEEARKMVTLCRKKGIVLAVNHQRRLDSHYRKIKSMLDAGRIGKIQNIIFYYSGGLANIGTHVFDLLLFLFGEVKSVLADSCNSANSRIKDPDISGKLHFNGDIPCYLIACNVDDHLMFELDIIGTTGRIRSLSNGSILNLYKAGSSLKYSNYKELGDAPKEIRVHENQRMICAVNDIMRCIKSRKQPDCSGEDGYGALEIAAAFFESMKKKKKVNLPVKNRKEIIFSK